jgi:hypothetical protein
MRHAVDFIELVSFFDKVHILLCSVSGGIGSIFDCADEFKPQFEDDYFSSRIHRKNISYLAFVTDKNKKTNSNNDYRYLGCECNVWIFDEVFRAKIQIYGYRGLKNTSTGMEKTLFTDLEISEPHWSDLYKNLSSEFQKISLGRPLLQFLLHDFYSEGRYEQFKNVALKKLQDHSLEHLIQP